MNTGLPKIKLVHVVTTLCTGGMENGIVNLCNRHDRKKFEVAICCLKSKGNMVNRLRKDVSVFSLGLPEGKPVFHPIKVAKLFKLIRPDIVHTHGLAGGSYVGILAAKLAKVPVIINGEHGSFFLKPHQVFLQRFLSHLTDVTLSVSDSLRKEISKKLKIPSWKIKVIRNGVDTNIFSGNYPKHIIRKEIAQNHGVIIDDNSFVLGNVASLKPEKNQKMILEAVKLLNDKYPGNKKNIKVLLVGDGPDRVMLKSLASKYDIHKQVVFLGVRDDVHRLLSVMDVVILSSVSFHEGLSNVLLEAMSSGVPVVATNSVGTIEVVKDGETGFIIQAGDIEGLCNKIEFLQKNPKIREKMSYFSRKWIRSKFSIKNMVDAYEYLYMKTLERKRNL